MCVLLVCLVKSGKAPSSITNIHLTYVQYFIQKYPVIPAVSWLHQPFPFTQKVPPVSPGIMLTRSVRKGLYSK